jgi:hypothetical protein
MDGEAIAPHLRSVLEDVERDERGRRAFLTAYQILDRLKVRDQLIAQCKLDGGDGISHHLAAGVVRDSLLANVRELEVEIIDTSGATFEVAGKRFKPAPGMAAVYRLSDVTGE